jgi:hypothetical protein
MRMGTAVGILLGLVVLAGCGGGGGVAKVSGKVTVGGQPVTGAMINFISATGVASGAPLKATGEYEISIGLKPGDYKVFVVPASSPDQAPMPGKKPVTTPESNVPLKYRSDATSGLTATLKAGRNANVNFALD